MIGYGAPSRSRICRWLGEQPLRVCLQTTGQAPPTWCASPPCAAWGGGRHKAQALAQAPQAHTGRVESQACARWGLGTASGQP